MKRWAAALAFILVAGCLGQQTPTAAPQSPAPPDVVSAAYREAACANLLLFQFVPYHATDRYLPPGFHPRDPRDFLGTPVAFGQAGVILFQVACASRQDGEMKAATVGIFVESPAVPGLDHAQFDFYEVERYAGPSTLDALLSAAAWPLTPAQLNVTVSVGKTGLTESGLANVTDADGQVAFFAGVMATPFTLGPGPVRFWHDAPDGAAYIEYRTAVNPLVGGGGCILRAGTALADLVESEAVAGMPRPPPQADLGCPPGEPVLATFPGLVLDVAALRLPGVHAQ